MLDSVLRMRASGGRNRRASLVVRFGLVSAVLAGLLGIVLTSWLTAFIRSSNVAHAENTATYSMGVVMGAVGVEQDQPGSFTGAQYTQVTVLLKAMVATGKFVGASAWTPDGIVVYAIEPGRLGRHERTRPQVAQALRGQVASAVVKAPLAGVAVGTERSALRSGGPLLEVFVPVRLNNRVVAAVGFYQRWQPIQQAIDREVRKMLLLVGAGLVVLWAGLLRLVWTASRKLRAQSAANWELASHDRLTGLANRELLQERVQQALRGSTRSGRHCALLLLDLDRFKEVNDTLGHHVGDLLLQQVGPRLEGVLRDGDSIARLGGDEFVVLLTDLEDPLRARDVAKRIVMVVSAPFRLDSMSVDVDVSIGIALSPQHGTDFDELLQHADIAMYAAKTSRSGFAVYAPETDQASPERLAMLGQLRQAVEEPSQLLLHYQPKADLVTGEVLGVEALVRWQHPTRGLLPPGEFIPLAERTGLIRPLTVQVLAAALTQVRAWNQQGLKLQMAVNISTRCLDEGLPDLVSHLLQENQVPSGQLELEITESTIMADPDRAITVLTRLQALGVGLSIDDFGTGYSSMAYLKLLPVNELKIDQSFVTGMTKGSTDTAIVRSCIELAHNLGMTVIAEGVETASVWSQLTELGCNLGQGYYLAKPMPADTAYTWMTERSRRGVKDLHSSAIPAPRSKP
jgi:diguanylate cyclase (GGDEF)-like protein